jgi:hypothetical protein
MEPRKKLGDIVKDMTGLRSKWTKTAPAADLTPIPKGEYVCTLDDIRPDESKKGTPRLKITISVAQGEYAGRKVFHDAYLSDAALPYTLRLLGKIGLDDLDAIDRGIPPGIMVRAWITLKTRDDGEQINEIKNWELAAVNAPSVDSAGPQLAPGPAPTPTDASEPQQSTDAPWAVDLNSLDEDPPKRDDGPTFDYGANEEGGAQ